MKRFACVLILLWAVPAWGKDPEPIPTPPKPADTVLTIPAETRATSDYVRIVPTTNAAAVLYFGLSGVDPFPSELLKDGRVFCLPVRGLAAGRYKFIGVGTLSDSQVRADFAVIVGTPTPDPLPVPPTPPVPADTLQATLQSAYAADTFPGKDGLRALLAAIFRNAATTTSQDAKLTTTGALLSAMHTATAGLIGDGLPGVRAAIATELNAKLPTSGAAPLDKTTRDLCAVQFARMATILEGLK